MKNVNFSTCKRDFGFKISIFNNRAYFQNLDIYIAKFSFQSLCIGKPQTIMLTLSQYGAATLNFICVMDIYLRDGVMSYMSSYFSRGPELAVVKSKVKALVKTQEEKFLEALTISFLHRPTLEKTVFFYPSKTNVPHHIKISQVIYWFLYNGEHCSLLSKDFLK